MVLTFSCRPLSSRTATKCSFLCTLSDFLCIDSDCGGTSNGVSELEGDVVQVAKSHSYIIIGIGEELVHSAFAIYDCSGRMLVEGELKNTSNTVDLDDYSMGLMVLCIQGENGSISRKFFF